MPLNAPILMSRDGVDTEPIVRGAATRRPLALDAFRDVVREVIAKGGAQ